MGYLARRDALEPIESWLVLESAADGRFWDGLSLGAIQEGGREAGAIYMLGYTAEMLLKAAYCKYMNHPHTQQIRSLLTTDIGAATAVVWVGRTSGRNRYPDLHDLSGIAEFLIETRRMQRYQLDPSKAAVLMIHIREIEQNRKVEMRYSAVPATSDELNNVFESVYWIRQNYDWLWRK